MGQTTLEYGSKPDGPVECLGLSFENNEKRREFFLNKLREKLQEPEFRKIEGFPIGSDEDILALSDPPYYTACPNPFINDFIKFHGNPYDPSVSYHREPFAADVSEGKNDPIYNAHSYHTKVPHKAIMHYILHYTEPGDVVFDGFCGTGMTGVAAQLCSNPGYIADLGYKVDQDGNIRNEDNEVFSRCGSRTAILNDLSPAATLIAAGYCISSSPSTFAQQAQVLLDNFNNEYGWMYETKDTKTNTICKIDFTVWSEVFSCPHCSGELEFWDLAYDESSGEIDKKPACPHCSAEISKRELIRRTSTFYDKILKKTRTRQILRPVEINYQHLGVKKKKKPDEYDLEVLERVSKLLDEVSYPTDLFMFIPEGEGWGDLFRGYHEGISYAHDFHLSRQLITYSLLWNRGGVLPTTEMQRLWRFLLQSVVVSFTRRNRYRKKAYSQVNTNLSGTLYVGSTISEPTPTYCLSGKIKRFVNAIPIGRRKTAISTQSLASILIADNSVDYIFIDPPFGDNLPYAELNFLWEAWLKVFTKASQDAIVNGKQKKDLLIYTNMMADCLREVYRILKPGRWVTVEFHNSKNAVWTAIQEAMGRAGFIIADVSILDKGMKTKKQMNAKAVDKDLVISAYKPNGGLEKRFQLEAGTEDGVWDFIKTHLRQLPISIGKDGLMHIIAERQQVLLFDRMVAFHVMRGVTIPLSAAEFYAGLEQRFSERDGMYFLPEQAMEYDVKRVNFREIQQLSIFVSDEASAILWLKQLLLTKPQTYSDIFPQFIKEISAWNKHEKTLELKEMLDQNYLTYDGMDDVPTQIHSYLSSNYHDLRNLPKDSPILKSKGKDRWYVPDPNRALDLEKLRERALMREFDEYQAFSGRKLKTFRLEAIRTGFKKAWSDKDYRTIINVANKVPDIILQEDPKLTMWYDGAMTRAGE